MLTIIWAAICISCATVKTSHQAEPAEGLTVDSGNKKASLREPPKLTSMDGAPMETAPSEHPNGVTVVPSKKDDPKSKCNLKAKIQVPVPFDASAEALHRLGQDQIRLRNAQDAALLLAKATALAPDDPYVWGDFATALLQCRLNKKALKTIEKAVSLAPSDVDLLANLAQIYQITDHIQKSIETYQKAAALAPSDAAIHNNLAVVLLVTRNLEGAEEEQRKAIELNPGRADYWVNLGYILARRNRFMDAETVVRKALKLDSNNPDAHNQMGLVLLGLGQPEAAIESFRDALDIDPNHHGANENLKATMKQEGFDFVGPWNQNRE